MVNETVLQVPVSSSPAGSVFEQIR